MKKLFVGGLSWGTDNDALRGKFEEFGTVTEAKVIYDRETDRSRGFGFVTFTNNTEAEQAMQKLDGTDFDGRLIKVNEAEERQSRPAPRY